MSAFDGVTFGDKHTYKDWGLYMLNNPVLTSPEPQTSYVDIPGTDGMLDLTEALTGRVQYRMRTLTVELHDIREQAYWHPTYSEIADYLHGQKKRIILDTDPGYYYIGRCSVGDFNPKKGQSILTITATCEPYKRDINATGGDWLWDTFSFTDGIIRDYNNIDVYITKDVTVVGSKMPVSLSVTATITQGDTMAVGFKGGTAHTLHNGENVIPQMIIGEGEHVLTFVGVGTVSINFDVGRL